LIFFGDAALICREKHGSDLLRETRLWIIERTRLWSFERNAALNCWDKRGTDLLRDAALICLETQACILQFDGGDTIFMLVKGQGLQNAAFEASHAFW